MSKTIRHVCSSAILLCGMVVSAGGCLQIETRVKLNEDGTAKVTERMLFTRRLLDAAGDKRADLVRMLSREGAMERMKEMGEGISLVQHEVKENKDGSIESVTEISVPDLNKFRYVSPWPAYADWAENNAVRARLYPRYKTVPFDGSAGMMVVSFAYEKPPKGQPAPPKDKPAPKGPSPAEQQIYRDIAPVIRDLVKGLRLRFTFESYASVRGGMGARGAGTTSIDLIDVSDANLDQWAGSFWENEEVMLEVARTEFWGPNIVRNVQGYDRNFTLPVFFPSGSPHMWFSYAPNIEFRPSKALFEKHFAGKTLDYNAWGTTPPEKQVPARWEDIGWQAWKDKREQGAGPPKDDAGKK